MGQFRREGTMRYLITMTVDIEEVRERKVKVTEKPIELPKAAPVLPVVHEAMHPLGYGVKEAAKLLGISRSSIYALMKSGLLKAVRIGRRTLFTEEELRGLLVNRSGLEV